MTNPYERVHAAWAAIDGFDLDTVELLLALYQTFSAVDTRVMRVLSEFDLSVSAFNILMLLNEAPDGIALHALSDLLVVSRTNVTRLVQSMVARGLVDRSEHPDDRRVRVARITAEGSRLAKRLLPVHLPAMRDMLAGVPEKRKRSLIRRLTELREALSADGSSEPA